jgi:CheY-like chemotaxis protein
VTYSTGEALLSALGTRVPSCAILDQHLPGLTGLETFEALRRLAEPVPAIIVTAHDETGLAERCLASSVSAHILKPVGDEALKDSLAAVCNLENDRQADE